MRRAAGYTLAVLTLINLFNYLDRWVIAALVESLRKSELHLTDTELGFIASGFIIIYTLASPVFGTLGDRRARPPLIAFGVMIWSIATTLGGFARGFTSLFVARSTVGVGEAAYGTIAPALLADSFPLEKRGRVLAIFFAAIPIGSAAGYIIGGLVDAHFGWPAPLSGAGAPGRLRGRPHHRRPRRRARRLAGRVLGRGPARTAAGDAAARGEGPAARRAGPHGGARAERALERGVRRSFPQFAIPLRGGRLRRVHVRARRPRVLDAGVPRARARHGTSGSDGDVRRDRLRDRLRRHVRRRLARRLLPQTDAAVVPVGLRDLDAAGRAGDVRGADESEPLDLSARDRRGRGADLRVDGAGELRDRQRRRAERARHRARPLDPADAPPRRRALAADHRAPLRRHVARPRVPHRAGGDRRRRRDLVRRRVAGPVTQCAAP